MGFSVKNDPEGVSITIEDSVLDRSISGEFRHYAADALEGVNGRVSVDCSAIDFIDSSGVGALLHVNNLLPEERRPVILTGVSSSVLSVLELVRVHRLFEIVPKD